MVSFLGIVILLASIQIAVLGNFEPAKNFGPYKLDFVYCEECKATKSNNVTNTTLSLIKEKRNWFRVNLDLSFFAPTPIEELRCTVYSLKDNRRNILLNYKFDKPCEHFAIGTLLKLQFGPKSNCIADKKTYHMDLNITDLGIKFFGSSFFYGEYITKSIAYSRKANIICILTRFTVTKKH